MRWRVIYGGQTWIDAESEAEAYAKFWEDLRAKIDRGEIGLAIPDEEAAQLEGS